MAKIQLNGKRITLKIKVNIYDLLKNLSYQQKSSNRT